MLQTLISAMFSLVWGSGLKYFILLSLKRHKYRSPSYEGVDWNKQSAVCCHNEIVLPRMREWIEIRCVHCKNGGIRVLPRMREWIEIHKGWTRRSGFGGSPSYEGVDWNLLQCATTSLTVSSPSYEGVDWNKNAFAYITICLPFSLVWGSGLKLFLYQ